MKYKSLLVTMICLLAFSCLPGAKDEKDGEKTFKTTLSNIKGTWDSYCLENEDDGTSKQYTLIFTKDTMTEILVKFSNQFCSTNINAEIYTRKIFFEMDFRSTEIVLLSTSGTFAINNANIVTQLIDDTHCGKSDWEKDVEVDITNISCDEVITVPRDYIFLKVKSVENPDRKYFGKRVYLRREE